MRASSCVSRARSLTAIGSDCFSCLSFLTATRAPRKAHALAVQYSPAPTGVCSPSSLQSTTGAASSCESSASTSLSYIPSADSVGFDEVNCNVPPMGLDNGMSFDLARCSWRPAQGWDSPVRATTRTTGMAREQLLHE
eukprot:scaffold3843_cov117-Isochrysis_galbana.AAC.4